MVNVLKVHLWTLPRWFAVPFFGASFLIGVLLAGGSLGSGNTWVGFIMGMLIMAGGHSFNSFLDYAWTGLDRGEEVNRSAEKSYTGGQNVIETGQVTLRGVLYNALGWYIVALIPIIYLSVTVSWWIFLLGVLGMLMTFWYSKSKFNYTHELCLGIACGPLPVLMGMFSTGGSPPVIDGLIASVPIAIVLSFAGLALDEWPDAEANLKKGVKSISYKAWEYQVDLSCYLTSWILILYAYQVFIIQLDILAPLTGLTFLLVPILYSLLVMMKGNFDKFTPWFVITAAFYPILLVIGQAVGGE